MGREPHSAPRLITDPWRLSNSNADGLVLISDSAGDRMLLLFMSVRRDIGLKLTTLEKYCSLITSCSCFKANLWSILLYSGPLRTNVFLS